MTHSDCFAVAKRLLPLSEALALIAHRVQPVTGEETISLDQALGRVLANPLVASLSQPPFVSAAMDGFALRFAELADAGRRMKVAARIAAGHPLDSAPPPGSAVQIFTGAPLPEGFDTVVMQEDCSLDADHVLLPEGVIQGSHVRQAGIDFKPGDRLLPAGRRLRPQDIGIAAALGLDRITVRRRLRIGLFSTGDELVAPGQSLAPGQIYDSNRPMLRAALTAMGFEVRDLGRLPDQLDSLVTAFGLNALDHDVLVSTGGVSVGGEDHVRTAIEKLGQIHFWKLAIKPGKPLALGHIGQAAFLGLPGNPVSSLVSLLMAGRALLHHLAGAGPEAALPPPMMIPSASEIKRGGNRQSFLRASLADKDGRLCALPYFSQDSSLISSLVESGGLIELDCGTEPVKIGEPVAFHLYESLLR
jgi:molybdopterin molybdotransferase